MNIHELLGNNYLDYLLKDRIFHDKENRLIEIVGTTDKGRCNKLYHEPKEICINCILNCSHTIKINGILQEKEYTHEEILMLKNHLN